MDTTKKSPAQVLSLALSELLSDPALLDAAADRIQARMEKNDACPLERTDGFMPAWEEKIS
jgi:hypothetical protein